MRPAIAASGDVTLKNASDLFRKRWEEAAGEYYPASNREDLATQIVGYFHRNRIASVVLGNFPMGVAFGEFLKGEVEILIDFNREGLDHKTAVEACSRAEAGVTGADGLIAATGSVVLASRSPGDRLCSTLPPVHLIIALNIPVFADLEACLAEAPHDLSWTAVTGPSRTADIEKQLVLGAHGPRKVALWGSV